METMDVWSIVSGIFACLFGIYLFNAYSKDHEALHASQKSHYPFYLPAALFFLVAASIDFCNVYAKGLATGVSLMQLLVGAFTLAYLKKQLSPRSWQAFLDVFIVLGTFCIGLIAIPSVIFRLPPDSPLIPFLSFMAVAFVVISPVRTILLMRFLAKRREKLSPSKDDEMP